MPKYVIERAIPGAGNLKPAEFQNISLQSCNILKGLGPGIQWIRTYITANKVYSVYNAESIALVKEHARIGGIPVMNIAQVTAIIDPTTAED